MNIAVYMLDDAYQNRCEQLVLVSGDSDLVPPIKMIRARFPEKRVVVYVPARDKVRSYSVELRSSAHRDRELPLILLKKAQFPTTLPDGSGGWLVKPATW